MKERLIILAQDTAEFYVRLLSVVILLLLSAPALALSAYVIAVMVRFAIYFFKLGW